MIDVLQSGGQAACPGEEDEGPGLLDGEQMQVRLERVWNALHLPEGQRLDMAIKYSSHEYRDHLQEVEIMRMNSSGFFYHDHQGFMLSHGCICAIRQLLHGSRLLV